MSLFSPSLLSMDVCFACVYFSIVNFPWVPFSFAFFRHLLFYLGLQPFAHWCQHGLLILDFAGERRVEGVGRQLFRGLERGYWGVGVVSCCAIHILQTYFSVPGQKSDTFPTGPQGFLDPPDCSLFLFPPCFSIQLQWSSASPSPTSCSLAFPETCFTYYCSSPTFHLGGTPTWKRSCFWKEGGHYW